MSILNNIINEFDIALKTLSDKKAGTDREYPPTPVDKNTSKLSGVHRGPGRIKRQF